MLGDAADAEKKSATTWLQSLKVYDMGSAGVVIHDAENFGLTAIGTLAMSTGWPPRLRYLR